MAETPRFSGQQRRQWILDTLKTAASPVTGTELAKKANVSRQVIVQDIALLRAAQAPILATPQGYLYYENPASQQETPFSRVIACKHRLEETELELNTMVDHGLHILDVIVEHPIYGELRGSLMIKSRRDVQHFLKNIRRSGASLLSSLTGGVHLHTVAAESEARIDEACAALARHGILLRDHLPQRERKNQRVREN